MESEKKSSILIPDNRPVPDPTVLTTQQLALAIAGLKELINVQLGTMDEELDRIRSNLDTRAPAIIAEISHLRVLMDEKFKGVGDQFTGRDVALAAALLAQKTSVDEQNKSNALSSSKSEAGTTKQIDGIQTLIVTMTKATDDKVDAVKFLISSQTKAMDDKFGDLKDLVNSVESRASVGFASNSSRSEGRSDVWSYIMGAGGLIIAAIALVGFLTAHSSVIR